MEKGREVNYLYDDSELEKLKARYLVDDGKKSKKDHPLTPSAVMEGGEDGEAGETIVTEAHGRVNIQRYKGLGEMNPQQLWETTMDPARRMMKQVTVLDAEKANEIFDILMGAEVAPRKKFIQTHAKSVSNLDI